MHTVAALDYGDTAVREWLMRFKHGGRVDLAGPLGRWVRAAARDRGVVLGARDRLVPVPLHGARRVERGYDQAAALAAEIARGTPARVARNLVRVRPTTPQGARLGRARRANVREAFDALGPRVPEGVRMWIVDDVMTSGATADACARALVRAGAQGVGVLVAARVDGRGDVDPAEEDSGPPVPFLDGAGVLGPPA